MVRKAVFLDRDGVINANCERDGRPVAPTTIEDFRLVPEIEDMTRRLKAAGFLLIVITNQPDISTGRVAQTTVDAMHALIRERLPIDDIKVCPHVDDDMCACRKPKPGLMLEAAEQWGIDLGGSYMIGDRWRDIEAGRAAGCLTIHLDLGYGDDEHFFEPDSVVQSPSAAARLILSREQEADADEHT